MVSAAALAPMVALSQPFFFIAQLLKDFFVLKLQAVFDTISL
jgi:hypothetical protein